MVDPRSSAARRIRLLFRVGILAKGVDGLLEIIGGLMLLVVSPDFLRGAVALLTAHELSEDPDDWLANSLRIVVKSFSHDTESFASAYLVGHGVIKLVLVAGLWRGQRWAYPTALAFMSAFIVYQVYRLVHTHSLALLAFTAMDVFIVWFVWRDYQLRRHRIA
jgi:uncharacterized membrane protein